MKLSNQAIGAIMLALQKSLMDQSDIVPMFQGFELINTDDGVVIKNPPIVKSRKEGKEGTTMVPPRESFMPMTKAEVLKLGRDMGVKLTTKQTKDQLVDSIYKYMNYA